MCGNILTETETMDNPYRYAGYYYDTETGNYYLLSRYYNPNIARFISEDTYRGELNDPLSLNRYVYVHNNPLIYYDPNGYFLIESLEWLGKRAAGLVHGTGELAVDVVIGVGTLAYNTGEFIGSSIGVAGNYYAYQLGITNKDTYNYLNDEYMKTFSRTSNTLINLPSNLVTGVTDNFKNTFNADNFVNYLTTDNYNEIKDYSKSAVQTGLTIYGGYKLGEAVYNKASTAINDYKFTHQKIDTSRLEYSNTALKQLSERPFMKSNIVIDEIMKAKKPIIDPKATDALKWDVPGAMGKKGGYTVGVDRAYTVGNWELIVNPTTNTIYHFNFTRLK